MDKTEKLIDWKEDERKDTNRDGIDDRIEPPIPDISAGSAKLRHELHSISPDARWILLRKSRASGNRRSWCW